MVTINRSARPLALAVALSGSLVAGALTGPVMADAPQPGASIGGGIAGNGSHHALIPGSELRSVLATPGSGVDIQEQRAVSAYLRSRPNDSTYLGRDDVKVGTVELDHGVQAVVVSPRLARIGALGVRDDGDGTRGQLSAGLDWSTPGPVSTTSGPGMGSWPKWNKTWTVELKLYDGGSYHDYIGRAIFQTRRRKFHESSKRYDRWQFARYALGQPSWDDLADRDVYVQKLWASNRLKSHGQEHAQKWLLNRTWPLVDWSDCNSGTTYSFASFTFPVKNCGDYHPWLGKIGHYRLDYDQGKYAGGANRVIAYRAGIQMDNGAFPGMHWYEFVTLQVGHWRAVSVDDKCHSNALGEKYGTKFLYCYFG